MKEQISAEEEARYAELQLMALECARRDEVDFLSQLLDAGMPVNLSDFKGNTLLMLASYHGNVDTTRLLLDRGADVDRKNNRGQTPLGGVAFKGYLEIAKMLIQGGANVEADQGNGIRPMMLAAMFGRTEMVKYLSDEGASLGRKANFGLSPKQVLKIRSLWKKLMTAFSFRTASTTKEGLPLSRKYLPGGS